MIASPPRATIADLHNVEGKAELIAGRIVRYMATGSRPSLVAANIYRSIHDYCVQKGVGEAYTDTVGFAVPELANGRESFSPDASFYDGPRPDDEMDFLPGPPSFAVEVRSKSDRGPAAEFEMATKRADYFEAGTLVVWDVDVEARTVTAYRASAPESPTVFTSGVAEAEPAIPGWTIALDTIFGQ